MPGLRLTVDDRDMRKFLRKMPRASTRSLSRAMNKSITRTRTLAAREVSARRNIKVSRARKDMRIEKANTSKLIAAIHASGHPVRVYEVKGIKRQTKKGVTAKIEAQKRPHLFKSAFIAQTQSGHIGVFMRTTDKRLPIIELKLPSVAATMVNRNVEAKLREFAIPFMEKELFRLLNYEMTKAGAR